MCLEIMVCLNEWCFTAGDHLNFVKRDRDFETMPLKMTFFQMVPTIFQIALLFEYLFLTSLADLLCLLLSHHLLAGDV